MRGPMDSLVRWLIQQRLKDGRLPRGRIAELQGALDVMLELAAGYPEYRENAARVRLVETTSSAYYGPGYQDVQSRVPKIDNTMRDLGWKPQVNVSDALRGIFDAYRTHVAEARELVAD